MFFELKHMYVVNSGKGNRKETKFWFAVNFSTHIGNFFGVKMAFVEVYLVTFMTIFRLRLDLPGQIFCRQEGYYSRFEKQQLLAFALSCVFSSGYEKFLKTSIFRCFQKKFRLILMYLSLSHAHSSSIYAPTADQERFRQNHILWVFWYSEVEYSKGGYFWAVWADFG